MLGESGTNHLLGLIQHTGAPMSLGEHRKFCAFHGFTHGFSSLFVRLCGAAR
jgi:hypothetical protein